MQDLGGVVAVTKDAHAVEANRRPQAWPAQAERRAPGRVGARRGLGELLEKSCSSLISVR